MRRLLLAGIAAIGAHAILFFIGPDWVLPKISHPKWSVQPVEIQLNAISENPAPASIGKIKKVHRAGSKPHRIKKEMTSQVKKKNVSRRKPEKVQTFEVKKRRPAMPLQKTQQRPKQIKSLSSNTGGVKKAEFGKQEVKSNMPVTIEKKPADTSPDSRMADNPDNILPDAPITGLSSFPQTAAQGGQALVEAIPAYLRNPPPPYPSIARRRGYEGTVVLQVFVTKNGRVGKLKIFRSSGHKALDEAAIKTVGKWIFEPGRRGLTPIDMWVKVPIKFVLR